MVITWPTNFWKKANKRQQTEKKLTIFKKYQCPKNAVSFET